LFICRLGSLNSEEDTSSLFLNYFLPSFSSFDLNLQIEIFSFNHLVVTDAAINDFFFFFELWKKKKNKVIQFYFHRFGSYDNNRGSFDLQLYIQICDDMV
jgi:hypothetical protein